MCSEKKIDSFIGFSPETLGTVRDTTKTLKQNRDKQLIGDIFNTVSSVFTANQNKAVNTPGIVPYNDPTRPKYNPDVPVETKTGLSNTAIWGIAGLGILVIVLTVILIVKK